MANIPSPASDEPFVHQPLDLNTTEVRLLRLQGFTDQTMRVQVGKFDFSVECPPYKAVSYTWGPPISDRDHSYEWTGFLGPREPWPFFEDRVGSIRHSRRVLLDRSDLYRSSQQGRAEPSGEDDGRCLPKGRSSLVMAWAEQLGSLPTA